MTRLSCLPESYLGFPQFVQNLPVFSVPQEQIQPAGLAFPHSGQNFPEASVPQEQIHLSFEMMTAVRRGSG